MWAAHAERQLLPQKERLQRTVAALSSKSSCSYESDFADLTTPSVRTKVASRYFLDRASTPPLQGGEYARVQFIHTLVDRRLQFRDAVVPETFPNFCRRNRNIDMTHTEMPQRIHDSVDDSCRCAHRCRLSDTFGAQWVMR